MPILIVLVVLILVVLIFGPLVGAVGGIFLALGGMVWGLGLLAIPALVVLLTVAAYLIGAVGWLIWLCFDPKGALESLRLAYEAKAERDAAKVGKSGPP